jgi:hypothetical protein|nr:MAG TPA: hypothetical protein [Caudoviricetes sp.]
MFENEKLMVGEHFTYEGIEWICLDIIDGNYLAITAKVIDELPFDTENYNNWKESSLRRVLNEDFVDKLNKKHLVMQTSDLIADNGDKMYGTCEDYVTILSCDQYRKYRELVPHYPEWMWTLTPWNCSPHASYASNVRSVAPSGIIYSNYASYSCGVAPACLFSSKHLKLCRQAHLVEIDESAENEE